MKTTNIKIELREFEGFEYTGEFRYPVDHEEWGHNPEYSTDQVRALTPKRRLFILRKVEPPSLSARLTLGFPNYTNRVFDFYEIYKGDRKVLCLKDTNRSYLAAGSMQGFFKFVYEGPSGFILNISSIMTDSPAGDKTIHPVGALFYKVAE